MKKVLFVCLGNICRSPMAHGIFRDKVKKQNLPFLVDSAGTSAFHAGEAPDKRSINTLLNKGMDISDLTSRQFLPSDFDEFDVIITMDKENQKNILRLAHQHHSKNLPKMMLSFIPGKSNLSVPDPYYDQLDGFEKVYQMLDVATNHLIEYLKQNV